MKNGGVNPSNLDFYAMLKADRDISKKKAVETANDMKNGHRLPEVRVESISKNQKVTLEFTNEMVISSDL